MTPAGPNDAAARAKAVLVDPSSLGVIWTSESAGESSSQSGALTLEQVVPLSESIGLPEALRAVSSSGTPAHLSASLVSTSRGAVTYVVSVYRLPDGTLLVLSEHVWRVEEGATSSGRAGRSRRKR